MPVFVAVLWLLCGFALVVMWLKCVYTIAELGLRYNYAETMQ